MYLVGRWATAIFAPKALHEGAAVGRRNTHQSEEQLKSFTPGDVLPLSLWSRHLTKIFRLDFERVLRAPVPGMLPRDRFTTWRGCREGAMDQCKRLSQRAGEKTERDVFHGCPLLLKRSSQLRPLPDKLKEC